MHIEDTQISQCAAAKADFKAESLNYFDEFMHSEANKFMSIKKLEAQCNFV